MQPLQAITTCLRKSFQFSGRASRPEFWWFAPFYLISATFCTSMVWSRVFPHFEIEMAALLFFLLNLPVWAVAVRRLHDVGRGCGTVIAMHGTACVSLYVNFLLTQLDGLPCREIPGCVIGVPPGKLEAYFLVFVGELMLLSVFAVPVLAAAILVMCAQSFRPFPNTYGPTPLEVTP